MGKPAPSSHHVCMVPSMGIFVAFCGFGWPARLAGAFGCAFVCMRPIGLQMRAFADNAVSRSRKLPYTHLLSTEVGKPRLLITTQKHKLNTFSLVESFRQKYWILSLLLLY